ncbi:MAG: flavodoxin [Mucilaginibacter polytrichastri]|nr:flavodoxin [Mucilaginibacter polytrichastri]
MRGRIRTARATLLVVWGLLAGMFISAGRVQAKDRPAKGSRVLIVYLSRTQNTKAVAEMIRGFTGGELLPIELETPYPADYKATVAQVAAENERGYLPPLKTHVDDMSRYDVVFVGFPTWGMQLPPPVKSFLEDHDLRGKIVVPFNTNAGYGAGDSFSTLKTRCPGSDVREGLSVRGGAERDGQLLMIKGDRAISVKSEVQRWLEKLKLPGIATLK